MLSVWVYEDESTVFEMNHLIIVNIAAQVNANLLNANIHRLNNKVHSVQYNTLDNANTQSLHPSVNWEYWVHTL